MASRCRSFSKPAASLFKSAMNKPSIGSKSASPLFGIRSSVGSTRPMARLGSLQSLLPLHSVVSSARLTSCLGIDSNCSRSLSQGVVCCANPGV
ncbi:PREDICTED: uncharacterized protein LOC104799192 [Tarenaya hassleriana]|uniref:uncharacterized protein LOC104799192 n=1 Tax=Tarenaya hassleriana TaxID=28532 RepID=UPI00053C9724|nr:PREDICTED: uncharacterized protein LOC104799192 [Tarenaya hassleriana]XP_010519885.1 PREDICTED: uncharacterized protein LOC104799192 [Tarenaya hassleriana]XP_010519886.1 PREDICTED: uncharacterized protein LOC104799192 [Tarenaya hassleriana]